MINEKYKTSINKTFIISIMAIIISNLSSVAINNMMLKSSEPYEIEINTDEYVQIQQVKIAEPKVKSYQKEECEVTIYSVPNPEIDMAQTTYDRLTDKEIHLIEATIQHEVGNFSEAYQKLIAELIYNRLMSDEFPNTVEEVLYQENQFCGIEDWYSPNTEIDDTTKGIVEEVFNQDDTTHDAMYYYNPEFSADYAIQWFEYSGDVNYLFEYEEDSYGKTYTTRFFK